MRELSKSFYRFKMSFLLLIHRNLKGGDDSGHRGQTNRQKKSICKSQIYQPIYSKIKASIIIIYFEWVEMFTWNDSPILCNRMWFMVYLNIWVACDIVWQTPTNTPTTTKIYPNKTQLLSIELNDSFFSLFVAIVHFFELIPANVAILQCRWFHPYTDNRFIFHRRVNSST